jgi:hypothetical protein
VAQTEEVRVIKLLGACVATLVDFLSGRTRIVGEEAAKAHLSGLRASCGSRSVVFFHWSEDEVPRLVASRRLGWGLGNDVAYVTDDTIGGRLGSEVLSRFGHRTVPFRASHPASRIEDARRLIRELGSLSISADARGPYRIVSRSLPQLVRSRRAIAVPVSVLSSRSIRLRRPGPIVLPLPGAQLAIALGSPVVTGDQCGGSEAFERALWEVRSRCRALLRGDAA